ncbi:hypothetical protein [Hypericibacter sp.]
MREQRSFASSASKPIVAALSGALPAGSRRAMRMVVEAVSAAAANA